MYHWMVGIRTQVVLEFRAIDCYFGCDFFFSDLLYSRLSCICCRSCQRMLCHSGGVGWGRITFPLVPELLCLLGDKHYYI